MGLLRPDGRTPSSSEGGDTPGSRRSRGRSEDGSPGSRERQGSPRLQASAFPRFEPLLRASEAYAKLSGCRFRSSSFDGIEPGDGDVPVVAACRGRDRGPRLGAKIAAAPAVREFGVRLRAREPELLRELHAAFALLMEESVRNAMVSTCRRLDLWPPTMSLVAYADMDLPSVAARLYEEEQSRTNELAVARTAAYLVDFMAEHEVPQPELSTAQHARLDAFTARALAWEDGQREPSVEY